VVRMPRIKLAITSLDVAFLIFPFSIHHLSSIRTQPSPVK
jgi:hypothetical protein